MKIVRILAGITFLEGVRNRFFYGLLMIALLLIGANLVITHSFAYDLGKVAVDIGLSATAVFGLMIIFFLGIARQRTVFPDDGLGLVIRNLTRFLDDLHNLIKRF